MTVCGSATVTCRSIRMLAGRTSTARRSAGGKAPRSNRRSMINRQCVQCSQPFATTDRRMLCCSRRCGNTLAQTVRAVAATERRRRVCEACGEEFIAGSPSGQARAGKEPGRTVLFAIMCCGGDAGARRCLTVRDA